MDLDKTRTDVEQERQSLQKRLQGIDVERQRLNDEETQIVRRLTGLDQIAEGLDLMATKMTIPDLEPLGFTAHVRKILNETRQPLFPTQIRDLLAAQGQTASSSKHLLISVHTVLDRIEDELKVVRMGGGKLAYISKNTKIPPLTPPTTLIRVLAKAARAKAARDRRNGLRELGFAL
jgi:hypothetical protein